MHIRLIACAVAVMVTVAVGVLAQTPAPAPAPSAPAQPAAPVSPAEQPQGFTYNRENRRDPFVSLLRRGGDNFAPGGQRPAGLAGLMVSEVTLRGTVQGQSGFVAMLLGADQKTYIVRPGDRLLDGIIRSITPTAVVILQQVNDPLSLEKQREVRKTLRETEAN